MEFDLGVVFKFLTAFKDRDWLAAGEYGGLIVSQVCHVLRGPHVDAPALKAASFDVEAALLSDTDLAAKIEETLTVVQSVAGPTPAGLNPLLVVLISEAMRRVVEELIKRLRT